MSFWQAKTKLRPADTKFSKYLRELRGWKCEKCGIDCSSNHQYLTVSHYHGRRKESVRFDEENCDTLCRRCHLYFEEHKEEYSLWKIKKLGRKKFDALLVRANTPQKKDDEMILTYLKNLL